MKIMLNHSAKQRLEAPHSTTSTQNNTLKGNQTISIALKRRAQSVINDRWIDAQSRAVIRYGLATNDPWLPELVRRVDAGETVDTFDFSQTPATDEDDAIERKIETLTNLVCRPCDQPLTKFAAFLVLMAMLEKADHPKVLANSAKHLAFARCAELNLCGMVDAQIAVLEGELLAANPE
jgi:hypothetical protein